MYMKFGNYSGMSNEPLAVATRSMKEMRTTETKHIESFILGESEREIVNVLVRERLYYK